MTGTEQQQQQSFACAACGKQYRWKAELAGKRVKCKCGQPVAVPAAAAVGATSAAPAAARAAKPQQAVKPPAPPKPVKALGPEDEPGLDLDGLYALANDEQRASATANEAAAAQGYRCPGCGATLAAGAAVCPGCGTDLRTGCKLKASGQGAPPAAMLAYAGSNTGGVAASAGGFTDHNLLWEGSKVRNLYAPLGLAVLGLVAYIYQIVRFSGGTGIPASFFAVYFSASILLDCALIFAALVICTKLWDMAFGPLVTALLKIFAIAIGPGAVGAIIEVVIEGNGGLMMGAIVGSGVSLLLIYALSKVLFDLEWDDNAKLAFVIYFLRRWVRFFILLGLISLILSSGAGAGGPAGIALTNPDGSVPTAVNQGPSPAEQRRQMTRLTIDGRAEEALGMNGAGEAREWLKAQEAHTLDKLDRAKSLETVENLYKLGAKKVSVAGIYRAGYGDNDLKANVLIVELPTPDPNAKPAKVASKKPAKAKPKPKSSSDDDEEPALDDDEIDQEMAATAEGMNATLPPAEREARAALLAEEPKINQMTSGRLHQYPDVGQKYIVVRCNGHYNDE